MVVQRTVAAQSRAFACNKLQNSLSPGSIPGGRLTSFRHSISNRARRI